jgi:hypothetical protein
VVRGWGFVAETPASPWRPFVDVYVRLWRARDGATLLQERVGLNSEGAVSPFGSNRPGVLLNPSGHAEFATFAQLTAASDRTAEGLRIAFENVANATAQLLA